MASYIALLSSLPALMFPVRPLISEEMFFSFCESAMGAKEFSLLKQLTFQTEKELFPENSLAYRYLHWERSLRNALVRLRAGKNGTDPALWLREEWNSDVMAEQAASAAFAQTDPEEREKMLDRSRWQKLDELTGLKMFDFDTVCVYRLKLAILAKWNERTGEKGPENLEKGASLVSAEER